MYKTATILFLYLFTQSIHAADVSSWVKQADAYRLSSESAIVELEVELHKDGRLDKTREYRVYIKPDRRSLVVFKSAAELGQKVLMRDEQFHMFMPKTRRAIRITPMQKLLGEASTGDLANMTWNEDYTARSIGERKTIDGIACEMLELRSHRQGTTYERIELCLTSDTHAPIYAWLYLKSGKLAKEAKYSMGKLNNTTAVTGMTLIDRIKPGRRTEVKYRSMSAVSIPDKYYNPQFLLRNQVD